MTGSSLLLRRTLRAEGPTENSQGQRPWNSVRNASFAALKGRNFGCPMAEARAIAGAPRWGFQRILSRPPPGAYAPGYYRSGPWPYRTRGDVFVDRSPELPLANESMAREQSFRDRPLQRPASTLAARRRGRHDNSNRSCGKARFRLQDRPLLSVVSTHHSLLQDLEP